MIRSLLQVHSIISLLFAKRLKKKTSSFKTYHSNGNLKVLGAHEVKTGSKTGIWHLYGKNGNLLKLIAYENDKLNGKVRLVTTPANSKKLKITKNGKLDGEAKLFLNNGNLFQTKSYRNGISI